MLWTFSQKIKLKLEEKAGVHVCFDGIDQLYKYFFFLHVKYFVIGEWLEKNVIIKPHLFSAKHCRLFVFINSKKIVEVNLTLPPVLFVVFQKKIFFKERLNPCLFVILILL